MQLGLYPGIEMLVAAIWGSCPPPPADTCAGKHHFGMFPLLAPRAALPTRGPWRLHNAGSSLEDGDPQLI